MKVVILAGGFGSRLSEYTEDIPKPMVTIGSKPILWHIMKRYASFGHNEFILALGYKSEIIKKFFIELEAFGRDLMLDLSSGEKKILHTNENKKEIFDWKVSMINTGLNTMTGGRLKRLKSLLGNEPFLLTYGDGVSNVDFNELVAFHNNCGGLVTMTAVRPQARFGELKIDNGKVTSFKEKPKTEVGWINGGFFVIDPKFLDYIDDDTTVLEQDPLERCAKEGLLNAFEHNGFWQCMDTKRDRDLLNELAKHQTPPWF